MDKFEGDLGYFLARSFEMILVVFDGFVLEFRGYKPEQTEVRTLTQTLLLYTRINPIELGPAHWSYF